MCTGEVWVCMCAGDVWVCVQVCVQVRWVTHSLAVSADVPGGQHRPGPDQEHAGLRWDPGGESGHPCWPLGGARPGHWVGSRSSTGSGSLQKEDPCIRVEQVTEARGSQGRAGCWREWSWGGLAEGTA